MEQAAALQLGHARLLRARGNALPPGALPDTVILDSWVRCADAGLDWHQALQVPVVSDSTLRQLREEHDFARRMARAELETLSQQIAGSNHLLVFADPHGVVLDAYADNRFVMSAGTTSIVPGSCWSEERAGTNGLGTALATGRPVAVCGLDHFYLSLGDVTCTAAPVRDARGAVVGALDASSYFQSRQQHTLALVQMAATHVENAVFVHQMRGHVVLALHPRSEYLQTLSAGLAAFDGDGRLLALNARTQQWLHGLDARPGTPFEALFGEPFERALARADRQGELRLRDALGSTLVAQCLALPPGEAVRGAPAARAAPPRAAAPALPAPAPARRPAEPAQDPALAAAYRLAERAMALGVPLLIQGETGTGKELLARHLHEHARSTQRRTGEFVAVNCAALPGELIEAELFGYVPGAFTGARREGSRGLIASADGGTLLLDEVRELPLNLQGALLRFLDEPLVRPVGGTQARRVDVRLLAATHADLERDAAEGRFRADLLYRLNTVSVQLPPLRARSDFAAQVHLMLEQVAAPARQARSARLADDALALLAAQPWPGNFRELRSVLTRAWLALPGTEEPGAEPATLTAAHLRPLLLGGAQPVGLALPSPPSALQTGATEAVKRAHAASGGSISETARRLGISRTTVYRHLRQAGGG